MKYKVLTVLAAAALTMTGGCSAGQNTADNEAESIVIEDMEIIEESEETERYGTEEEFIVEDASEEPVPEYSFEVLTEKESEEETSVLSAKISRKTPSSEQNDAREQLADAAADLASSMEEDESYATLMLTADRVNARSGPSTDDEAYGVLVPGTRVAVLDPDEEWSEIRYMNEAGEPAAAYVKTEFLADASSLFEAVKDTDIYAEPSIDAAVYGNLSSGEEIVVTGSADGFSTVRYTVEGKVEDAYVPSDCLKEKDASEGTKALLDAAAPDETALTELITETAVDEETEEETEAESAFEEETELVNEAVFEEESETEFVPAVSFEIAEGAQSQFAILQAVLPGAQTVGIIYSGENEGADEALEEYDSLAASAGMKVNAAKIESVSDIDLIAAELVGEVDAVFCLDDEMVNELIRTIDAYADEVSIPVIGIDRAQVEDGALAAYLDGVLYWNKEEAEQLGADVNSLPTDKIEEI